MIQITMNIISYGALILLLMPQSTVGIVLTLFAFVLGFRFIKCENGFNDSFCAGKQIYFILFTLLLVFCLGSNFFNRWISSNLIQIIADILHIQFSILLFLISLILSALSFFCVFHLLQTFTIYFLKFIQKHFFIRNIICSFCFAMITVSLAQYMVGVPVFSMGYFKFAVNVIIVLLAILFLYCLSDKIIFSIFVVTGIFLSISTINVYVYLFRGHVLEPLDFLAAKTAMNVLGNYSLFPVPVPIITGWAVFFLMMIGLFHLHSYGKYKLSVKNRLALFAFCIVAVYAFIFSLSNLNTFRWHLQGVQNNGYILDFTSKFKAVFIAKPEEYSPQFLDGLADQYAESLKKFEKDTSEYPNIIVIMDEAFSDLGVAGEFTTNREVTPFISSLKENAVTGYALASVWGGNTANSEYEFLTGNSFAWLSPSSIPYQQYIRSSTYSMVSYLKSYGYRCLAMHPFESSGWNRPAVYGHLGFDACYFEENFPQKNYVRSYISDQETFEFLIETYEKQKKNPLFIHCVTMQNHGGYTYTGENFTKSISLNEYGAAFPDVEQYLSLIHETDKAVEYLIHYFEDVQEDVVIVFFGDHQPKINDRFYESISLATADTLDERQKRYLVPFFIWTNYDLEEKYVDCTSLNYLSSYVYDAAGIPLPLYNRFLQDMEKVIPAINANGFYSLDKGCYLPFGEANESEQEWLRRYEALQYNSLFDQEYRNEAFFPALQ